MKLNQIGSLEGGKQVFWGALLWAMAWTSWGQTATISGSVVDAEARYPLMGATVQVLTVPDKVTAADLDGRFKLEDVPLGRHALQVSFMGYEPRVLEGIVLTSGRPVVLDIDLQESVVAIQAAEVSATQEGEVMNEMATVSARAFTVEETDRYAGSRGDPARMASNFAGVQGADDSRNDIVVRGNSPSGVLWRVEGVDLPNPNHFAIPGTGGGPVAIVNNKTLANSDFFTAAFPAEFGNSTAAVFDLRLRNGNQDQWHGSAQLGFLGTEVLAEGRIEPGEALEPSCELPVLDGRDFLGAGHRHWHGRGAQIPGRVVQAPHADQRGRGVLALGHGGKQQRGHPDFRAAPARTEHLRRQRP